MDLSKISTKDLEYLKAGKLDKVSTAGLQEINRQMGTQPVPSPSVVAPVPYSTGAETARAAAQGLTFGFADELEAAFRSGRISGAEYERIRDQLRAQQGQFAQEQPVRAGGTELAASLVAPAGVVAKPVTRGAGIVGDVLLGSGLGALTGAGKATEDVTGGTVTGALLGGGGTAVLSGGGRLLAPAVRPEAAALREQGIRTLTDLTKRPGFASKMADVVGSLTSNDRMTMSILQDNTDEGYTTYYTSQDRNQVLIGMVQKENESRRYQDLPELSGEDFDAFMQESEKKLIPMQKDASGVYQPMISDEQRDRAKKTVEATIEMQLEFKSLEDEPRAPGGGGGGGGSVKAEDKPEYYKTAADVRKAWVNGDVNALSSLSGGKYLFEKKGENTYLIINASNPKDVKGPFYKLDDVGSFFGVGARDTWTKKMGKARSAAGNQPQANITQEQFNTKWATLKPGQTLKGPDGKTYTKK